MHLVSHTIFDSNNKVFTFNLNGTACLFTNCNQYVDNGVRYKWKNSTPENVNDRYVLYGDGNYVIENDNLVKYIAFVILLKVGTNEYYVIQNDHFRIYFIIA